MKFYFLPFVLSILFVQSTIWTQEDNALIERWSFCESVIKSDSISKLIEKTQEEDLVSIFYYWGEVEKHCKKMLTVPNTPPTERNTYKPRVSKCLRIYQNKKNLEKEKNIEQDYACFVEERELSFSKDLGYKLVYRHLNDLDFYIQNAGERYQWLLDKIDTTLDTTCVYVKEKGKFSNPAKKGLKRVYFLRWDNDDFDAPAHIGFRIDEFRDSVNAKEALALYDFQQQVEPCLLDIMIKPSYFFRDENKVYSFSMGTVFNWNFDKVDQFLLDFMKQFPENEYGLWFRNEESDQKLRWLPPTNATIKIKKDD